MPVTREKVTLRDAAVKLFQMSEHNIMLAAHGTPNLKMPLSKKRSQNAGDRYVPVRADIIKGCGTPEHVMHTRH